MIRTAKAADVPGLAAFLVECNKRSKYAQRCPVDVTYTKQVLIRLIMLHGGRSENGTHCLVSESEGKITGLLFGIKDRVMGIGEHLYVTDFLFAMSPDAPKKDAAAMFGSFISWGKSDTRVIHFTQAHHDALPQGDVSVLYVRHGFKKVGELYELDLDQAQENAA